MMGEPAVRSAGRVPLVIATVIIPFISWGSAPLLTGVFALLVTGAFLAMLPGLSRGGSLSLPTPLLWIPFLAAYALSVFHLARSPVPYSSLLFLAQFTVALVFYYSLQSNYPRPPILPFVLIWTVLLSASIVIQVLLTRIRPPAGPFVNPNYLATVLLSCLGYALGSLMVQGCKREEKTALWTVALICTAGLMTVGSRSAGLGVVLVWVVFLVFDRRPTRWVAVVVIAAVILLPSAFRYRVTEGYQGDPHSFSRIHIWKSALNMGADHPLAGVGPNLFYEYGPRYAFPTEELPVRYGRIARKPHNEYLRSWAEGGVIGAAAALLFIVIVLRYMAGALREGRAGPALAVSCILFMALFHDLTESFALMVLTFWWLAQLAPDGGRAYVRNPQRYRIVLTVIGLLVLGSSLWVNLDLVSRINWQRGQRLVDSDINGAMLATQRAVTLNPLLPGAARDLAKIHLMISREEGSAEAVARAQRSIVRARTLNRLDTAPLRLHAAFYMDLASLNKDFAPEALESAERMLLQASKLEPYNVLIPMILSGIYWDQGHQNEALELVNRALTLEPNYLEAHRTRISYLSRLDPAGVGEARRELDRALKAAAAYRPVNVYEEIILR